MGNNQYLVSGQTYGKGNFGVVVVEVQEGPEATADCTPSSCSVIKEETGPY